MQPVPCWEKVWVTPNITASSSSTLKVYKWIKTEKLQQFSDDEGEVDEPLVPLPDEPEVVDGDEDEQDEARNDAIEAPQVKDLPDMDTNQDDPPSKMPSPKPQLMILESSNDDDNQSTTEVLDASLKPLEGGLGDVDDNGKEGIPEDLELDISALGPDGLQLESSHDLSQLDGPDGLIGGPLMDESGDPFVDI